MGAVFTAALRKEEVGGDAIWSVAGREAVQHADSDAGWRLERRDSGLKLGSGS